MMGGRRQRLSISIGKGLRAARFYHSSNTDFCCDFSRVFYFFLSYFITDLTHDF